MHVTECFAEYFRGYSQRGCDQDNWSSAVDTNRLVPSCENHGRGSSTSGERLRIRLDGKCREEKRQQGERGMMGFHLFEWVRVLICTIKRGPGWSLLRISFIVSGKVSEGSYKSAIPAAKGAINLR